MMLYVTNEPTKFKDKQLQQTLWLSVRKRTIPTDYRCGQRRQYRLLRVLAAAWSVKWVPTAVNFGFLHQRSDYFFK
jgi:hypothetical protein